MIILPICKYYKLKKKDFINMIKIFLIKQILINYTACHLTVFNIAQNSFEKKKKVRSFMFHNMMF